MAAATNPHLDLADLVQRYYEDPLGFVMMAFPWGEPGPLKSETGPDDNQREFLRALGHEVVLRKFDGVNPVRPIRMAASSGHGTGKTAMGAWIACWILSTRPYSTGTVTAGTATQLEERTWSAIQYWVRLSITAHWFEVMASGIYAHRSPNDWKIVAQTCKEENAQSFAGQHARTSTSWYMFDEASAVPDTIWQVAYGGLTDGEPMFFAWGQPERNTGEFHNICFGKDSERWNRRTLDSRSSRFTNKQLIEEWLHDYGEDSDWVRVRVLGLPPLASEFQFIDHQRIRQAMRRPIRVLPEEPLIAGVDVSGGGAAWNVVFFRRGMDARTIPRIRIPGEAIRHDRGLLVGRLAELLSDQRPEHKITAMFIDSAFGSPIIERLHMLGFQQVHEINFGGDSPNQHQANMRAYMWDAMKEWLLIGAIPEEEPLSYQLGLPGYHLNRSNKLVLESKQDLTKRGERSPDDADGLALTFARKVAPPRPQKASRIPFSGGPWS